MQIFTQGIVESEMLRASLIRLITVACSAWIVAQSVAQTQSGDEVKALIGEVEQLYNQGKYGQAIEIAEKALSNAEEALGPEHPLTLESVQNLGVLYKVQGRYEEAEPLYKRSVAGTEKALGPEHSGTLTSINNLAVLYEAQGRHDEAEPLYKRVLATAEKVLGSEHRLTLTTIKNLGGLYGAQGRLGEAEMFYKRALAGREKALGAEHPDTLESVHHLAALYRVQGRLNEAAKLLKRAIAGQEKVRGPEHPDTLATLNTLGQFYIVQGRYAETERLWKRVLSGREKVLGAEHPDTLQAVNNLAVLHLQRHDWKEATRFWRRSTTAIAKRIRRGTPTIGLTGKKKSESEQKSWQFRALIKVAYRLATKDDAPDAALSDEMFQTAQWALSSEAARSIAQMAARGANDDPVLASLVRERQDLADEWHDREKIEAVALGQDTAKRNSRASTQNRERMDAIDRRVREIDEQLKVQFPDYAVFANPVPLALQDVQTLLGSDEALVLFLDTAKWEPTPEETFIWVVTKTQTRWVRSHIGNYGIYREVYALRCGMDRVAWEGRSGCANLTGQSKPGRLLPFDHARAYRFYDALFGQVKALIKDKHLLIVPSGTLTQLPFSMLVTEPPQTGRGNTITWLARDHAVTILPAVSSLKALRRVSRPSGATKVMIGFGNPLLNGPGGFHSRAAKLARENQSCPQTAWQSVADFFGLSRDLTQMDLRSGLADPNHIRQATPLPETTDELCAVARSLGADTDVLWLGARATEKELKRLSENGRLAQYRIVHFATHGAMAGELRDGSEPGLILTPPDQATEEDDGYLSASEIAALKLDADWVILSACNTAAGSATNAEALSGLGRAFIYAQTRALLVSHWYVNSQATVALVTAAMREIASDKTVGRAEALRRAMLSLIDSGDEQQAHPAQWAPFIVVGESARS